MERFEKIGAEMARRHQWSAYFSLTDDEREFIRRKAREFGFDERCCWRCVERGYSDEVESELIRMEQQKW